MSEKKIANNPELTPWFPPEVKPVHVGWYHTSILGTCPLSKNWGNDFNWWWDGKRWLIDDADSKAASNFQKRYWRGLAAKAVQL